MIVFKIARLNLYFYLALLVSVFVMETTIIMIMQNYALVG